MSFIDITIGLKFMHAFPSSFAGTSIFSRFRQRLPKLLKYCVIPLQLLLLLLVAVVVIIQLCCLVSHNTELVVVGQTSSHEPGGYLDQFSTRETVTMTANKDVDNECLKVTVFSIDRSDANPVNCMHYNKQKVQQWKESDHSSWH